MPTFRSDSSQSTKMTVTLTEIGRSGNNVTVRVNWSVTLGSATSNGAAAANNRTLYIKRASNGATLGSHLIKDEQAWDAGETYSGQFNITFSVGTTQAGTWAVYIQTSNGGTQSCIWTDRDYCTNFNFSWSQYRTNCTAASELKFSANPFENSVVLSWAKGADGVNNPITGYTLYYRLNEGAETAVNLGDVSSYTLNTSGFARGVLLDFRLRSNSADNTAMSGWSSDARKNRVPNTPTNPSVPKTNFVPGETIRLSFTNTGDPDDNLAGIEVATNESASIVGSRAGSSITYVDISTQDWTPGTQVSFRVRGYDAFGVRGTWSAYTATVLIGVPLKFNLGGALKQSARIRVNIDGTLKEIVSARINIDGVLKPLV